MKRPGLSARLSYWAGYWLPSWLMGLVAAGMGSHRDNGETRRIAVLLPEHLGDGVFTIPLLRALREFLPGARILVAAAPAVAPLFEACPLVQETKVWPPGFLAAYQLGRMLRVEWRPDLVIVPRADPDRGWAALVAVISGAPRRVSLTDCADGWERVRRLQCAPFFTETVRPPAEVRHERLRRLMLARHLGATQVDPQLEVWETPAATSRAAAFFSTLPAAGRRVAVGIGASTGQRIWPAERFARLIDQLGAGEPIVPVLIGSPRERNLMEAVRAAARTPVYFPADATLGETVAVLRGCSLFIGNDSGPAHLAAAAGLPVVVASAHPAGAVGNHPSNPAKCAPACAVAHVVRPPGPAGEECREGCVAGEAHCILGVEVAAMAAAARAAAAEGAAVPPGNTP